MPPRPLAVWAKRVLTGAGAALMLVAFMETSDRLDGDVLPSAGRCAIAVALFSIDLALAGRAWSVLFAVDPRARRTLADGFYVAQLGKYAPGGIWQIVGQVGSARRAGVGTVEASTVFTVFAVVQIASGLTIGAALAVFGGAADVRLVFRLGALAAGVAGVVVLDRRWMVWVVDRLPRRVDAAMVPAQVAILRAWAIMTVAVALAGAAFAVLLGGLGDASLVSHPPATAAAWVLSWTAGFAVVVIPAGFGVREGVLVALLGGGPMVPALIGASIVHRLVGIVSEAVVIVGAKAAGVLRSEA